MTPFGPLLAPLLALALTASAQAPDPFAQIAAYDFGADRAALNAIDQQIRGAGTNTAALLSIEEKLLPVLATPELKPAARTFVCEALGRIGSARCVPALAPLLSTAEGADAARMALERLPFPEASKALLAALSTAPDRAKAGIANSLGARRDSSASRLMYLLTHSDASVADAAAIALGRIGTPTALAALTTAGQPEQPAHADAILRCVESPENLGTPAAGDACRAILDSNAPLPLREAAFAGYARSAPGPAADRLLARLADPDPAVNESAIRLARRVKAPGLPKAAAERLPTLPPRARVPLLSVLGELADPAVIPAVTAQTSDTDEAVRLAAIAALGQLPANRDTLIALAGIAASPARLEAKAAATSLARARGEGLDDLLLIGAKSGSTAERKAFITALGERRTPGAVPLLLGLRSDAEVELRRAALQSLENLAGPEAHPVALAWMLAAPDPREALDAERLVILLGAKVPGALAALLAADASATDPGRANLARCLARIGGDAALQRMRDYLARGNADLTAAVIRAFATWPDAAPVDELLKLATEGGDARTAHLAMQSCLQLLGPDKTRPPAAKVAICATMLEKAARPDSRKLILGSLARISCPEAIALVTAHLSDPGCEEEARAALRRLQYASLGPPALSSSNNSGALLAATDGNPGSRWTTNTPMRPGQWLALDLHVPCTVRSVVLDTTGSDGDYPRTYEVWVGDTPEPAGPPALEGIGSAAVTEMIFDPPRTGRHVRIVQTGSDGGAYWSVHELKVEADPVQDANLETNP